MVAAGRMYLAAALGLLAGMIGGATAQTVTALNSTATEGNGEVVPFVVSFGRNVLALVDTIPLLSGAASGIPVVGISGLTFVIDSANQLAVSRGNVVLISCDASAYSGNIGAIDVFNTAEQLNPAAIVWYSTALDWCDLQGYSGSYQFIYSMQSRNDTLAVLRALSQGHSDASNNAYYATLEPPFTANAITNGTAANSTGPDGNGSGSGQNQNQGNPLGPSPSTAVAMIILYSITGVITALFLLIIITGAIRAHRNPERYGPHNVLGRPRQSRARGLARAMLETIPIVKFGERPEPKATDVELADGADGNVAQEHQAESERASEAAPVGTVHSATEPPRNESEQSKVDVSENGIAAATASHESVTAENQGCSICTEDFEIGQDQRVLPCDHRFHPACIDPWLLNVSGTCPLCRIDLRPQPPRPSVEGEVDGNGNPLQQAATGGGLPPPLAPESSRRQSIRAGLSLLGLVARPDSLTQEERLRMLRDYRMQQAAESNRRRWDSAYAALASSAGAESGPDEEAGLRARLRNAFRIRTRRTGQEEAQPSAAAPGASNTQAEPREQNRNQEEGPPHREEER